MITHGDVEPQRLPRAVAEVAHRSATTDFSHDPPDNPRTGWHTGPWLTRCGVHIGLASPHVWPLSSSSAISRPRAPRWPCSAADSRPPTLFSQAGATVCTECRRAAAGAQRTQGPAIVDAPARRKGTARAGSAAQPIPSSRQSPYINCAAERPIVAARLRPPAFAQVRVPVRSPRV